MQYQKNKPPLALVTVTTNLSGLLLMTLCVKSSLNGITNPYFSIHTCFSFTLSRKKSQIPLILGRKLKGNKCGEHFKQHHKCCKGK